MGVGKKWKSACFEVLSTKLEFQKGQVKFSIPSIPTPWPQPSCDPPRLLISFSTLFRATRFPPPLSIPMLPVPRLSSLYILPSFCPLFLQHRWSDSSIGLIFIHRVPAGLVHIVHYSSELLILVWHLETDGPDTSLVLFTGFPWSITGRLHETYVSSHGVLPFPPWIRESTRVNRLHAILHLWDSV